MSKTEMVPCIAVNRVNDAMPGQRTEVPAAAFKELRRQGIVRGVDDDEPAEMPQPSAGGELDDRSLIDLIAEIPEGEEYWTDSGKPRTEAFKTLFDRDVTAQERDAAWEAYEAGESA